MTEPTRALSAQAIDKLLLDSEPYLSCDDCFARVDTYVERRLDEPGFVDAAMEAHLAGCGACAEEAEALGELLSQEAGSVGDSRLRSGSEPRQSRYDQG